MSTLDLAATNLTSPPVLAFALGLVGTLVRGDLKLPDAVYVALSTYLLFAIGLKGGHELRHADPGELWLPALATLALGIVVPLVVYGVVRRLVGLSLADSAALAAHYGSVSVVTFTACLVFLDEAGVAVEGFMATLLALLEVPAIVVALLLVGIRSGRHENWTAAVHEVLTGRSVLLLVGGIAIGLAAAADTYARVEPFFVDLFTGVLTLFLLDLGATAAGRLRDLRSTGARLVVFAILVPLVNGAAGVLLGTAAGLSLGGATVMGAMAASASYIAAPAAVRIALPEANPGYYLTTSLGITFPLNLAVGIPLYYALARAVH